MLSTGVGTGGDVEGTDWDAIGRTMPRGRIGTPEDIAGLAIFLASRAGAFTVGDVITCDGGIVVVLTGAQRAQTAVAMASTWWWSVPQHPPTTCSDGSSGLQLQVAGGQVVGVARGRARGPRRARRG